MSPVNMLGEYSHLMTASGDVSVLCPQRSWRLMAPTAVSVLRPWVPWPASPQTHSQDPCWLRSCRR